MKKKETKNTEFGSETNSESYLKTGRASAFVDYKSTNNSY